MAGARRADASRRGMSDAVDAAGSITEGIMANQQRNGRNVAMPEENRPSWRPQDEEHRDDERFASRDRERMGATLTVHDAGRNRDQDGVGHEHRLEARPLV